MQKLHELAQSQLFELRAQSEEDRAAKQSEVNLLMDEVERAQTRLFSLEREKFPPPLNFSSFSGYSHTADSNTILENSLSSKEKIIYELNMELHNIEITLSNEREKHVNEIKKLNSLLYEKVQNSCCYLIHQSMQYAITYRASNWKLGDYALVEVVLEKMTKELQVRPTEKLVDDLRKKVKILQVVGYNSIEAEDWEAATSGEEMSKMESLLLDKNKKMEHGTHTVKLSEKVSLLETAEGKIRELEEKVTEQQKLVQKLEDDILKGYNSKERKGTLFDDWDVSESAGNEHYESSMLKVICNQRDRFRARLQETEKYEIRQLKENIGSVTSDLEKTKADNVKLYGKIRYVLDYNQEKVISRGLKKYTEDLESGFTSDVDSKYKKIYEEAINPFAAFSKRVCKQ
ncbi:hypothetical protein GQ457_02G016780 [Hibiscus cannabinus]